MPFDFKKEYKAFYQPSQSTGRVSKKRGNALCRSLYAENEQEGRPSHGWIYFDYVVPPLEGLWYQEGMCVQALHLGSYDDEPQTVERMHAFLATRNYQLDFSDTRLHHEIYLSNPRKVEGPNQKTVIRHPIAKAVDAYKY